MLWTLLALAHAGPPPDGIDLDNPFRWEDASNHFLDGPEGCWDLSGTARVKVVLYRAPDRFGALGPSEMVAEGPIVARLDNHRFTHGMHVTGDKLDLDVWPMMGNQPADSEEGGEVAIGTEGVSAEAGAGAGANAVREIIDSWKGQASSTTVEWVSARDGVQMTRETPVDASKNAPLGTINAFFPGTDLRTTAVDVLFPTKFQTGTWPFRVTLTNAQVHLRAKPRDEGWVPTAESASLIVAVVGFTVGWEQSLLWTDVHPCAGPDPSTPPPPPEEAAATAAKP